VTDSAVPGITPEAILAHLDGEDLPHVAAYLQTSPEGAALAAEYRALQGNLTRLLYRHDCPTTQQLGDYALRLPAPADQVAIAAHVITCPHCAAELTQIRTFLTVEDGPPPLGLIERTRRVLTAAIAPRPSATTFALRGAAGAGTQTYLIEDITISIDLIASARRGRSELAGLVWRERDDALAIAGSSVSLIAAIDPQQTTEIDEFGNFLFADVPPGDYRLEVVLGADTIVINNLRIGR
jgi:hypothetical protein